MYGELLEPTSQGSIRRHSRQRLAILQMIHGHEGELSIINELWGHAKWLADE